mgnify:CR=1 FL=1
MTRFRGLPDRTIPQAWDLRCEVREKLIEFLQERYPGALPKQRTELIDAESMAVKLSPGVMRVVMP